MIVWIILFLSTLHAMTEAQAAPVNIETGREGNVVTPFHQVDEDTQKRLEFARPVFWPEINWMKRFTDPELTLTQIGKPPLATNIAKFPPGDVINVQFPECGFPFGVDFGKNVGDKPNLGMNLDGPLGALVCKSYTEGDFYKGLCALVNKNKDKMWPNRFTTPIDGNMMPFLLTKNTCKVREVEDKRNPENKMNVLNAKFYCIKSQLQTKISKEGQIVAINSIKPGTRGIVSARIQQLPYKDSLAVTIEIMEVVITQDAPEKVESSNIREELNQTSFINRDAEASYLKRSVPEPTADTTTTEAKPAKKKKKDGF